MASRIDIIDDDEAVRDLMRFLLDSYGYDVHEHSSGESFLSHSDSKSDCLLIDQHMPGMTGLELIERLRERGDQTPALMITGRSDPTIEPRAAAMGVKVLQKPLNEDQLVLWIETASHALARRCA